MDNSASEMMTSMPPQHDQKFSSKGAAISKASKKEVRPLSGGISQKQFGSKGDSRSRAANQHHNLSMFDKIGGGNSKI